MLNRYISEKPKGRANKSKESAKRRVGRAGPKRGQFGSYGAISVLCLSTKDTK